MLTQTEYQQLIIEVNRLRNQVHLFGNEEISEGALDDLKHKITQFEEKNPDKISPDSPNYVVAGGVSDGFVKFKHTRRMLSLNDIFSLEELTDWQERWQNYLGKEEPSFWEKIKPDFEAGEGKTKYILEPKLDGLAIALHYENGNLVAAVTRGDGFEGELVTENVKQIKTVPKQIADLRKLEVRGEIFLTKSDFAALNQEILEGKKVGKMGKTGGGATFANPRNAASGTIRQLDSRIVAERNLSFVAYNLYVVG